MNRLSAFLAAAFVLAAPIALLPLTAHAAEAVVVAPVAVSPVAILPYGDWIVAIANTFTAVIVPVIVSVVGYLITRYAGPLAAPLRMMITDKLIEDTIRKWLAYGVQQVEGATRDKHLNIDVGSAVVAETLNRATNRAAVNEVSAWVLKQGGGEAEIAKKITRMLPLDEHTVAEHVAAKGLAEAATKKA